jgi:hypothetical protein
MRSFPRDGRRMGSEPHAANAQEKFMSRYMDEENSALFPFGWGLELYAVQLLAADDQPR